MRRSRLFLAMPLVSLLAGVQTARAADPPLPPLPPLAAAADTRLAFPSAQVRRWQLGDGADRLQHASLAFVLGSSVGLTTREPAAAAASAITFGVAKELWDLRRGTGFDLGDLAADAIGAGASALATAALQDQK